jgi:hypothetical protein
MSFGRPSGQRGEAKSDIPRPTRCSASAGNERATKLSGVYE